MERRAFSVLGALGAVLPALALATSVATAGQHILRVGPGQEYATIQAAVMDARRGSKIFVYPGIYSENVFVTKNNLQIIAQGDDVVVLPPGPPAGFVIAADHVTIRGFDIGYGEGCAAAINFVGSHNTFEDNFLHQVADCLGVNALVCRDPDGGSDHNTIARNTIDHADLGIVIQATTADGVNTGNVIRDNTLLRTGQTPIAIANGKHFLVTGNHISGSEFGTCILVGTLAENKIPQGHHKIVDNTMAHCAQAGISLDPESGATLTHNKIKGNSASHSGIGIFLRSGADNNQIQDNEARDNALAGIAVAGDGNVIAGNVALDNGGTDLADCGENNVWRHNTYDTKGTACP